MKKYIFLALLLPVFVFGQISENYTLKTSVFTMSGGGAVSTSYSLQSAVGQSTPIGLLTSASYFLEAGYFHTETNTPNAIEDEIAIPVEFRLDRNYPNPFNPSTTLQFQLPKNEQVKIDIYDLMGKKVKTLVNNRYDAGVHQVIMDASGLSSGTYFYSIQAGENFATGKCLLLK